MPLWPSAGLGGHSTPRRCRRYLRQLRPPPQAVGAPGQPLAPPALAPGAWGPWCAVRCGLGRP
eukprot:7745832-Lingulodinium_polyedra.AAC.1